MLPFRFTRRRSPPARRFGLGSSLLLFLASGLLRLARADEAIASPQVASPEDSGPPAAETARGELVAIGDVHGDAKTFLRLLLALDLIDEKSHWSGGRRRLILTGDLIDRGDHSRYVLELVQRLALEAEEAGGGVVLLAGNHEVMALVGDTQSVSAGDFAQFIDSQTEARRAKRRDEILARVRTGSPLLRSRYYQDLSRVLDEGTFDRAFPRGFFARRARLGPRGDLGRWLLSLPVAHRENDTLFVHGGISPRFAKLSADEINARARAELEEFFDILDELERQKVFDGDLGLPELFLLVSSERKAGGPDPEIRPLFERIEALQRGLVLGEDGPQWYRGLAQGRETSFRRFVDSVLAKHTVKRIVIGHTQPLSRRVEARFDERVYLIDTGMNRSAYGGMPSALRIAPAGEISVFELAR